MVLIEYLVHLFQSRELQDLQLEWQLLGILLLLKFNFQIISSQLLIKLSTRLPNIDLDLVVSSIVEASQFDQHGELLVMVLCITLNPLKHTLPIHLD